MDRSSYRATRYRAPAWITAILLAGLGSVPAIAADSALSRLEGSWSGGGRAHFEGGQSERLTCRAFYRGGKGSSGHSFSIRCASPSAKVELRAALAVSGTSVSGTWEERQHNAAGALSGTVGANAVRLRFTGGVTGGLSLSLDGANAHSVSLTSQGSTLKTVSIGLRRS